MTRLEALINGIKDLETPENTKTIKKLTEGITLMANEYRRRKAAETKAITEAKGFAELDELRMRSGLSDRAFLEGVGNDIIKSNHPDEVKQKLMNKLSDYSNYLTESANGGAGPNMLKAILSLMAMQDIVVQIGSKLKNKQPLSNNEMRFLDFVVSMKRHMPPEEWDKMITEGKEAYDEIDPKLTSIYRDLLIDRPQIGYQPGQPQEQPQQ
jgi:hypothetical protein